ncbi:hypothetical protein BTJ40_10350 [Microbulbifer sp. A4B17]|uniref:bacteriophage holin n=1 Tax=Microbulbifer sp. A4B17 TaxID=359370 RepID=UPI000D52DFC1|nr:bacteriophage holin [Microbulbifer sp. A4B17]AWF81186.1 hypothetical protein BTJ40_10350 [Microbulbifer sp. A4B17]
MNRCAPNALGVAIGVLWAFYTFFCGITAMFGWGTVLVEVLSSFYIGYAPTFIGAVIGAVWGFVDGYIAGIIIGWVYNKVAK